MSNVLDTLRNIAAWWVEGLVRIGTHMNEVYSGHRAPAESRVDGDADREAWEEEHARLALSPWWL